MHKRDNHIFIRVEALHGEHLVLRFLLAALGICIAGYLYFVGLSIMNVIANKEAMAEGERLQNDLALLEEEYFELTKSVAPEMGARMGLSQSENVTFVRRPSAVASNVQQADL